MLFDDAKLRAFREILEDTMAGGADAEVQELGILHGDDATVSTDGPTFVTPGLATTRR